MLMLKLNQELNKFSMESFAEESVDVDDGKLTSITQFSQRDAFRCFSRPFLIGSFVDETR